MGQIICKDCNNYVTFDSMDLTIKITAVDLGMNNQIHVYGYDTTDTHKNPFYIGCMESTPELFNIWKDQVGVKN